MAEPDEGESPLDVWVIDTCSILQVRREADLAKKRTVIFSRLTAEVEAGVLVFPTEVFGELDRGAGSLQPGSSDLPLDWATANRARATRFGTDFETVKLVLAKVPDVLDSEKSGGADEADPYVLALAMKLKDKGHIVTVVSEERRDRPDKMSLNTACGLLRLYCVPLMAFLRDRDIHR